MRIFDAFLNGYFLLLVLLFVTGGHVPTEPIGASSKFEVSKMDHWVAGFALLLVVRRFVDRSRTMGGIAFVRFLRALGMRLVAAPSSVYLIAAAWAIVLATVAIRRHLAFGGGPDIDIFDQALWNTAHGRSYRSSIIGNAPLLSEHFDPLELLLVPFYLVYPTPAIVLIAQAFALALGAVPLYWMARERFPHKLLAPLFPMLYLLYRPLRAANRNDYHPGALVPPFFLFALYFMGKGRWGLMILFLALAGLLKEQMAIAGVTIGIYLFFAERKRLLGLALVVVFGLWSYANFFWIIPAFHPPGGRYKYFGLYSTLDSTPGGPILAPFLDPTALLKTLTIHMGRKLRYLLEVFAPLAFLSLLSPARLSLGLPFLAEHLFTSAPLMTTVRTHHTADLLPFVFFSALWGTSRLLRWLAAGKVLGRRWAPDMGPATVAAVLLLAFFLFHDWSEAFHLRYYSITPHHERLYAVLKTIPPAASVSAQTPISPHLSYREPLYHFPDLGPAGNEAEVVILDTTLIERDTVRRAITDAVAALPAKGYAKILDEDGILVFERRVAVPTRPDG
ncbi:MAG TPA: DUF2079 domain-containing protein [Candidatus Methylomirabilis sp.]|nr:DUF2079 domain-containing protein [Candidatus Methylomirabilis sp.]